MAIAEKFTPYVRNIEDKVIEHIRSAGSSIKIAMAWFTSPEIKTALRDHKFRNPKINVEIIVDNNTTNDQYFYNTLQDFQKVGIVVYDEHPVMLHHKFMVIDETVTLMGSYNYSKKARHNLESICVCESAAFSNFYSRVFSSITNKTYIDENIRLLIKYPVFAQSLLSMYYSFNPLEFLQYKALLVRGECFTYDHGMGDRLQYQPGYYFNTHVDLTGMRKEEFRLPFSKKFIQEWEINNNQLLILDSYAGDEDRYHLINEDLEQSEESVRRNFQRIIDNTYTSEELEKFIVNNVDIVKEDRLWCDNFELFFRPDLLSPVFKAIKEYSGSQLSS